MLTNGLGGVSNMKKSFLLTMVIVLMFALSITAFAAGSMPTTGGIGTTIFYIVGGVLVVGAVVFLFVRSRMN